MGIMIFFSFVMFVDSHGLVPDTHIGGSGIYENGDYRHVDNVAIQIKGTNKTYEYLEINNFYDNFDPSISQSFVDKNSISFNYNNKKIIVHTYMAINYNYEDGNLEFFMENGTEKIEHDDLIEFRY